MDAPPPRPIPHEDQDVVNLDHETPPSIIGRSAFCASSFRGSLQLYEQAGNCASDSFGLVGIPWQGASIEDLPEYQDVTDRDDPFAFSHGFANHVNLDDLPWEIINTQDTEVKSLSGVPQYQDAQFRDDLFHLEPCKERTNHTLQLGIIKTPEIQSYVSNTNVNDLPRERFDAQNEHTYDETTGNIHSVPQNRSTGLDGVQVDATPDSQEELNGDSLFARGSAILWMRARSSNPQGTSEEYGAQAASSSGPVPIATPPPVPLDRSSYQRISGHRGHTSNPVPKV